MPLRIGFDLDGVLADMEGELERQAEILFGEQVVRTPPGDAAPVAATPASGAGEAATAASPDKPDPPEATPDDGLPLRRLRLTSRQQRRLWRHVESIDAFWESLKEIEPGTVARLSALAADRRWEVIFLTKRPQTVGATSQVQSQRWLEAHGFTLPSAYVVQGSRGHIAAALGLDFVIDDRPENCLDVVVDSRARAILVWRDDEKLLPTAARRLGIGVVKTVGECLDILTQLDAAPAQRPGVVDRVMRLLGLKEPANA